MSIMCVHRLLCDNFQCAAIKNKSERNPTMTTDLTTAACFSHIDLIERTHDLLYKSHCTCQYAVIRCKLLDRTKLQLVRTFLLIFSFKHDGYLFCECCVLYLMHFPSQIQSVFSLCCEYLVLKFSIFVVYFSKGFSDCICNNRWFILC